MTTAGPITLHTPAQRRRYKGGLERVEERLAAVTLAAPGRLGEACGATLRAGGKRVRPLLVLLSARPDRPLDERLFHAAAAVELLHMATLVHDDVLDRAAVRRGRPTVAHEFGPALAVSAGNFLLARAFGEIAMTGDGAAVAALSDVAVALSDGEVMQREQTRRVALSESEYERRCEGKTAALFAVSCRLGAALSGAAGESVAALAAYGRLIGLAFQVLDDILDCSGDEIVIGKRPGTDVREGTMTLPLLYAVAADPSLADLLARSDLGDAEVAEVLRRVAASGAVARARSMAMRYIDDARDVLARCPAPVERELLAEVAARVVARYT